MAKVKTLVEPKNDDRLVHLVAVKRDKGMADNDPVLKSAKSEVIKASVCSEVLGLGEAVELKLSDAVWLAQRSKRWIDHPLVLEIQEREGVPGKTLSAKEKKEFDALVAKAVEAGVSKEEAEGMTLADLKALVG